MLGGCAGMSAALVHKQDVVGKDVDVVIDELGGKGIGCSRKASVKGYRGELVGAVNCGIKEKALICPNSYGIYLSYDLSTNKVTSLFKDERANCF